jgi:hypothetical protein
MPRQPMLFATTLATDVSADALAEAGVAEVLSSPLVSPEVAGAGALPAAAGKITNVTQFPSVEILL